MSRGGVFCPGRCLCLGGLCTGRSLSRDTPLDTDPLPPPDRQAPVKILPCPKLRLRVVINHSQQLSQCYKVYFAPAPADNEKVSFSGFETFHSLLAGPSQVQVTSSGKSNFSCTSKYSVLTDLGGDTLSLGPIFFIFKQFLQKFGQIGWCHRLLGYVYSIVWEILDLPLLRTNGYSILS